MRGPSVPRRSHAPPLPALVRASPEDFRVEELPRVEPCGRGDHVHLVVEKRGVSTAEVVRGVARALGLRPADVGHAGHKDARAVARQTLSVEHVAPEDALALDLSGVRVLAAVRHGKKVRTGGLRGNRFAIVLRDTQPERADEVRRMLDELARTGLPNAFGPQRFGNRGDTGAIGAALVAGDAERAVALAAGRPGPRDTGPVAEARRLFDAGSYAEAARTWPRGYEVSARLSRAMEHTGGRARRALAALSRRELAFYVSAWQAAVFNAVLAERIDAVDRVEDGELAFDHGSGRTFTVTDRAEAQRRAAAFEVSPTGPLPGPRVPRPGGAVGRLEERVLAGFGVGAGDLAGRRLHGTRGARRPLRVRPEEVEVLAVAGDERALELRFTLPPGAFATALLHELCGDELSEAGRGDAARPVG